MYDMNEYEYREIEWERWKIILFPSPQKQQTLRNNLFIVWKGDDDLKWDMSELHLKQELSCTEVYIEGEDVLFTLSDGSKFRIKFFKLDIRISCIYDPYRSENGIYDKNQHQYTEIQAGDKTVLYFTESYLDRNLFILDAEGKVIWDMGQPTPDGFTNCCKADVRDGKLYYTAGHLAVYLNTIMELDTFKTIFRNSAISF